MAELAPVALSPTRPHTSQPASTHDQVNVSETPDLRAWTPTRVRAWLEMYAELAPCDLSPTLLEEKADIERALDQLEGRQAAVIAALYTVTNWTVREVADALGVHHSVVCDHRESALKNLTKILA